MRRTTGRLARVGVPAETWQAFRHVVLVRGLAVSRYLGDLVEDELKRRQGRPVEDISPDMAPEDQALVGLTEIRRSIDGLDQIASRLARETIKAARAWAKSRAGFRLGRTARGRRAMSTHRDSSPVTTPAARTSGTYDSSRSPVTPARSPGGRLTHAEWEEFLPGRDYDPAC